MNVLTKRSTTVFLILLIILGVLVGCFLNTWHRFSHGPVFYEAVTIEYEFQPSVSLQSGLSNLNRIHPFRYPIYLQILVRVSQYWSHLKAGEYRFKPNITPYEFLDQIRRGEVIQRTFLIVEGWTFKQIQMALQNNAYIKQTLKNLDQHAVMARLEKTGEYPEGRFFPDTYFFTKGTADTQILKRAYRLMEQRLAAAWDKRAAHLPYYSPYEALIAASLIEKEAALKNERALVAGVLIRRLQQKMPLQMDASVIYGLPNFNTSLSKADLRTPSPYNTYVHRGLPPTPISAPSLASIQAALHPAPGNELFYVARGDGKGHVFSTTLKEHHLAVIEYRRNRDMKDAKK